MDSKGDCLQLIKPIDGQVMFFFYFDTIYSHKILLQFLFAHFLNFISVVLALSINDDRIIGC